ncbi:hypothetical protein IE077_001431, partial [Cardiosporidium cionae]
MYRLFNAAAARDVTVVDNAIICVTCCGNFLEEAFSLRTIENYKDFQNPTPLLNAFGIACKNVPLWVRLLHIFNFCQIQVITLDLLLLPECNSQGLQTILCITTGIWWGIVVFGVFCRRKILVPPFLFDPLRPGGGIIREIH